MTEVKLLPIAEGVTKAHVSYLPRSVGETVNAGDDLIEFVTDKATFNLPAPSSGIIKSILVNEGDEVSVGQVVAHIE